VALVEALETGVEGADLVRQARDRGREHVDAPAQLVHMLLQKGSGRDNCSSCS
jgi:hypothetical protein